jgi:hypothetical protein
VVTDVGEHEAVPIHLEREAEEGYTFRLGLRAGFRGHETARIPIGRRPNPAPHPILKEIYFCEVAGQTLEAANVFALRSKVQQALEMIAPAHTLPLCYFRAARYDYSLPVYEEGSQLVCPVLTGPKIKGPELASLRAPVARWLQAAGYLMEGEDPEIQVVRPSDLRLVAPAAVIRSLDDPDIWMPTVEGTSPAGPVIGLLVHPAQLQVSERRRAGTDQPAPPSAPDVTALLRYVGGELATRGYLLNPWSLYAGSVRPEIWARTEELTDTTDRRLECYLEGAEELRLPIRHTTAGEVLVALQEEGITVFLAGDDDALAQVVGRYLSAAGFLRHPQDVRIETQVPPASESLDPDAIWTGERAEPSAGGARSEERGANQDFTQETNNESEVPSQ